MPRSKEDVRRRLQQAALELYGERGYDQTTAAEIAARAGVTERTYFRHFQDKREVLFDGETALTEILIGAVRAAPRELGPWDTLFRAFRCAESLFVENRAFSEPRRQVIAGNPQLQERELAKVRSLTAALDAALQERGVPARVARLAAQMGMAAFGLAFTSWLDDGSRDLHGHLLQAFREVHDLSSLAKDVR
jgi:AcrR family transcriptional regulator